MASKKATRIKNPFVNQGYISPEYFCDRQQETDVMLNHFENGRNITLVSPRRIGKTGLIKNLFYQIERKNKNAICLYIDIFATKNLRDFTEMFGSVVFNGFAKKEKTFFQKAAALLGSLRPVFSNDPFTGMPKMTITVDPSRSQMTIQQIFELLSTSRRDIYIAIDEFQQIANYPETGTEALLRSHIQFASGVHFIFAGSKFRLMAEMFGSPQRPFFQSTEMMDLKPLDREVYYRFANQFFEKKRGADKANRSERENARTEKAMQSNDRQKLMRMYENLQQDIKTAENNILFFTGKSKSGNQIVEDMQKKIDAQKEQLKQIEEKINALPE